MVHWLLKVYSMKNNSHVISRSRNVFGLLLFKKARFIGEIIGHLSVALSKVEVITNQAYFNSMVFRTREV